MYIHSIRNTYKEMKTHTHIFKGPKVIFSSPETSMLIECDAALCRRLTEAVQMVLRGLCNASLTQIRE